MKNILGISAGYHDAAVSLISPTGEILFAGHSERYSKNKNDADLHSALLDEIDFGAVDTIAYYEKPWKKQLRQWYSGQGIEWDKFTTPRVLSQQLDFDDHCSGIDYLDLFPIKSYNHHLSHAAAGFQTSPYDRATVVVIDAIGEWDTVSIWGASYDRRGRAQYKKLWRQTYPHSIGLFYSAITGRIGLRPLDEEYITMGMAAWGRPQWEHALELSLVDNIEKLTFRQNLHTGVAADFLPTASDEDLAASAQNLVERLIESVMLRARDSVWSQNLVYMGGVALNCLANRRLGQWFENIWIMPNPGDAGSSLGAAALAYGKKLAWDNAYLGHNIPGPYPVAQLLQELQTNKIAGVASGRAEFGPRALGNRSLLADPRGSEIKEKVNEIKRRQQFRPFAPVVLEEHARDYFNMPGGWVDSRYMQIVGQCLCTDLFPAIVHVDGTSRIQTVPKDGSGIRALLESWYVLTGCPMLLNTSLNIRGEPMVNDRADADRFEQLYGVKVYS